MPAVVAPSVSVGPLAPEVFTVGLSPVEDEQGREKKKFRRSCDRCTAKKIRCDGMAACSQCTKRGYECHYSARKKTGPRIKTAHEEHPEWAAGRTGLVPWLGGDGRPLGKDLQSFQVAQHGAPPAGSPFMPTTVTAPMPTLAMAAPSPFLPNALATQPVTQLLGKAEGEYLELFLREFNPFMPVMDEAVVRSALVEMLSRGQLPVTSTVPRSQNLAGESVGAVEDVQLANAHNAILWVAIAGGAILAGNTRVQRYAALAFLSLKECYDFPHPSSVSAHLSMSILFMMLGDVRQHRRYYSIADMLHKELGSPSDSLALAIKFFQVGSMCDLGISQRQYSELRSTEIPEAPRLAALTTLIRHKANVIYMHHHGAHLDFERLWRDMLAAEKLLNDLPGINCTAYRLVYQRGFLGLLRYWQTGDVREAIRYMEPIVGVMDRTPGIARMLPCWHLVHVLGMFCWVVGDMHNYLKLQLAQQRVALDLAALPDPHDLGPTHAFCPHPVCRSTHRMVVRGELPGFGEVEGYKICPDVPNKVWNVHVSPTMTFSSTTSSASSSSDELSEGEPLIFTEMLDRPEQLDELLQGLTALDELPVGELPAVRTAV